MCVFYYLSVHLSKESVFESEAEGENDLCNVRSRSCDVKILWGITIEIGELLGGDPWPWLYGLKGGGMGEVSIGGLIDVTGRGEEELEGLSS